MGKNTLNNVICHAFKRHIKIKGPKMNQPIFVWRKCTNLVNAKEFFFLNYQKIGYIVPKLLSFLNFGKLGSIICFENKINNLFISNGKQVTNRHVDKTEPSIDSIEVIFSYVL